jgi:NAD(P)-dependent dehydrogenase (short-subunit alcohol dehydrogenase family)
VSRRIAVVSGANRGLGWGTSLALAKDGYHVVMLARDAVSLAQKIAPHQKEGLSLEAFSVDVSKAEDVENLRAHLRKTHARLDVLINNAGVFLEGQGEGASVFKVKPEILVETLKINSLGPFLLCQALIPLMLEGGYGRVVNVSSGMGALKDMEGSYPAYRMSKSALNALTCVWAAEVAGKNIKVNSVCPGWVRTDMGGANAARSVDEGIQGLLWAAQIPDDGPSGGFFRDGQAIDW